MRVVGASAIFLLSEGRSEVTAGGHTVRTRGEAFPEVRLELWPIIRGSLYAEITAISGVLVTSWWRLRRWRETNEVGKAAKVVLEIYTIQWRHNAPSQ